MNVFFDTSALVKYFRAEEGTRQVSLLIQNPQNTQVYHPLKDQLPGLVENESETE